MQADKTTLNDLSIFNKEEEESVFNHLDFTTTIGGKDWFRYLLAHPYAELNKILETQQLLKLIEQNEANWPTIISNGTVMMVQKFYDSQIDEIPRNPHTINTLYYRLTKAADYSLIKFSVNHFIDFAIGLKQIIQGFDKPNNPPLLQLLIDRIKILTNSPVISKMMLWNKQAVLTTHNILSFGHYLLYHFKAKAIELVDIFSQLDAYHSMALAGKKLSFCLPEFTASASPYIDGSKMFHPLVPTPVTYSIKLNREGNFLF